MLDGTFDLHCNNRETSVAAIPASILGTRALSIKKTCHPLHALKEEEEWDTRCEVGPRLGEGVSAIVADRASFGYVLASAKFFEAHPLTIWFTFGSQILGSSESVFLDSGTKICLKNLK